MQVCLWDYVTCLVVVALVSYILSDDLSGILGVVLKPLFIMLQTLPLSCWRFLFTYSSPIFFPGPKVIKLFTHNN